jgi:Trypsin-co-occurring domain 2
VSDALVGLADAIEALREELTDAMVRGRNKSMLFASEPIELTVQAVVTKDVHGKIGWKVLEAGGKFEAVGTQTITLKLSPWWRKEDGSVTSNFAIAAVGEAGDRVGPDDR